ncbi:MAG: hypothetical protein K2I93_03915, partial [Oscillospiraceae bacterium]|nr:hypothetical protein [Oscillospiraceae bacterium]
MPKPTETKRKIPHIHIPDEFPPDIPGEPVREMSAPVQKKAETSPRDEMVRSRAELIREQLRRAAEEEARRAEQTDTIQEVLTDEATLPDTAPAISDAPDMSGEKQEEEPIKKPSAFKRFLNVFLDLDSDDEEEAETDEDDAWDVPEEDAWDEPEDIEDTEDVDEDVPNTAPFRKSESDKLQPSLRNLTDIPEQEVRPSLLSRFRQKRKKAVKKDSDQDEDSTPQKTDWRTLVAPPSPEIPETAVSDDDDFYTDDLPDIAAPPMPSPATPKAPDPETPAAPDPVTPEIPAPETPSVPEPTAPSLTELSVRQRRIRRLRNLEMFEDEPVQMYIPDEPEETAGTPQDVQEETKSEKRPAPTGIAAVLREALDESAEELAEMKAEPLPGKSDGGVKTRFLKRHWYFLAGILCFLLALGGMMTCISWGIDKAKRFVGSSSIKQS